MPVYVVRGNLPGATARGLQAAAEVVAQMGLEDSGVRDLHSTSVGGRFDGWFGCRYEADAAGDVQLANECAALSFNDVVETVRYTAGPDDTTLGEGHRHDHPQIHSLPGG